MNSIEKLTNRKKKRTIEGYTAVQSLGKMEVLERNHLRAKTLGESFMEEMRVDRGHAKDRDQNTSTGACGMGKGWGIILSLFFVQAE